MSNRPWLAGAAVGFPPARGVVLLTMALLGAVLLAGTAGAATPATPAADPLREFEFLGCGGEPGDDTHIVPQVHRLTRPGEVSFVVRHVATCGLTGRSPTWGMVDGMLMLHYELASADGSVVMCDCEYWAKFTFDESMMGVVDVRFAKPDDPPRPFGGSRDPRPQDVGYPREEIGIVRKHHASHSPMLIASTMLLLDPATIIRKESLAVRTTRDLITICYTVSPRPGMTPGQAAVPTAFSAYLDGFTVSEPRPIRLDASCGETP